MISTLQTIHIVAALLVLAEALNKLERSAPCARGLNARDRLLETLKALVWFLLALWSAGAIAPPFLTAFGIHTATSQMLVHPEPSLGDVAGMLGFASLIVRTRIKEG